MPLLRVNQFGEIEEFGFGDDSRSASITPDDGTVIFGEYGRVESRNRKIAEMKKKLLEKKKKLQAQRVQAAKAKKARQVHAKNERAKREMAKRVQAKRKAQADIQLARIKAGKNPFADSFGKKAVGPALVGFKAGAKYTSRSKLTKDDDADFGPVNMWEWPPRSQFARRRKMKPRYQKNVSVQNPVPANMKAKPLPKIVPQGLSGVDHPLAGFGYEDEPMGLKIKIKRPKISVPKIKIKTPKLSQVVGKQADKFLSKATKDVGKIGGKVLNAPLDLTHKALTTVPGVKDVYKGVDKLTGGTLTSLHRTITLPGRALQTGKVDKRELLEGVVNVVKIGAIVVSGGSAVAIIGAAAGALKNGPLGQSEFGRTLLTVGEVAGLAYGAGQGISQALQKKATDVAAEKAGSEVGKKAGPLGSIAASVAVQAGAAGFNSPGSKVPNAATAEGAAKTAQAANKASEMAAKKLAESGMKFSTAAAQDEAKKLVMAQAKSLVAKEFKQRTGIPLDIAADVAQGKVPSSDQLKKKLMDDLRRTPDHLQNEVAKIAQQKNLADPLMKKVLDEKQKIYEREIVQRAQDIQKVKDMGAKELVDHNLKYKTRAELYVAKTEALKKASDEARALREKATNMNTNFDEQKRLALEATAAEQRVLAMAKDIEPLGDEVAKLAIESERIKEDNAARLAIAEHGGKTKFTNGTNLASASDLAHPMLGYGLI